MSQKKSKEELDTKPRLITNVEEGFTLLGQNFPSESVTSGTRMLLKFVKDRGWILELVGDKEAIRRGLEPPSHIKRKIERDSFRFRWTVYREFISGIIERVLKSIRGY